MNRASDQDLLTDRLDIGALKSELAARAVIARTMARQAKTALAARALADLANAIEAEIATLAAVIAALKALHPDAHRAAMRPEGSRFPASLSPLTRDDAAAGPCLSSSTARGPAADVFGGDAA